MTPIRILILTANPQDPKYASLRLDEEVRQIEEALKRSQYRDRFQVKTQLATRAKDLRRALLEYQPHIVHFSGHGTGERGLVLENEAGKLQLVSTEALTQLFGTSEICDIECVLLNACYSDVQAIAIHQVVDCVIGMNQPIGDKAAIVFAEGFYDALGAGKLYDEAYRVGCNAITLEGIGGNDIPILKNRKRRNTHSPVEQPVPQPEAAYGPMTGAIADLLARPTQSQSFGNITISGSSAPFNAIQSGSSVAFTQTLPQSSNENYDLKAALEALTKLKQEILKIDTLSMFEKRDTESKINMLQEELQKPKPDQRFIHEATEVLTRSLKGHSTLATPIDQVVALVTKAY